MPKIIENVRQNLIDEAKNQIERYGYAGMTIRSVAKACNIGIGTIYNYFKSKEELVHALTYQDWMSYIEDVERCCETTDSPKEIIQSIYNVINRFVHKNKTLLNDPHAAKVFAMSHDEGHGFLRHQISGYLKKPCSMYAKEPSDFLPVFLAEAIIVWTSAGISFDELYDVLKMYFKE